ncbi:MAG TPA: type 4a pilus biogenesis protein PilO [Thermoleophilaceae bacterium]
MSLTDRDRKILIALVPLVAIIGYWFLVLAPKRQEASKVKEQLSQAQAVRDTAQQKASQLSGAKRSFAADYATVIRLGKSIPASVDMPSLLVQLDRAARGTGIKFTDVKAGERSGPTTPAAGAATPPGGGTGPTTPGAAPAQSGPGKAAQSTSNAVGSANGASAAAGGAAAPAGASGAAATDPAAAGAPGLETVPLDFEFRGSFFDLADFFHRMKRFVRVVNNHIVIRGRLMTINSFSFDTSAGFPQLTAHVNATVYLAPKAEGVDAGASPQGPAPAAGTTAAPPQPASGGTSTPPPTPTATVTPR